MMLRKNRGPSIPSLEQPVAEGEVCSLGTKLKPGNQTEEGRKEVIKGPDRQRRGQRKQMIGDNKRRSQQKRRQTVEGRKMVSSAHPTPLHLQHRSGCCLEPDTVTVPDCAQTRTDTAPLPQSVKQTSYLAIGRQHNPVCPAMQSTVRGVT